MVLCVINKYDCLSVHILAYQKSKSKIYNSKVLSTVCTYMCTYIYTYVYTYVCNWYASRSRQQLFVCNTMQIYTHAHTWNFRSSLTFILCLNECDSHAQIVSVRYSLLLAATKVSVAHYLLWPCLQRMLWRHSLYYYFPLLLNMYIG